MRKYFTQKFPLLVVASILSINSIAQCPNFLINGGFEIDATTGWTTLISGGDGFAHSNANHSGSHGLIGSYSWSSQEQVVDLIASGFTALELDASPNIEVSEWYKSSYNAQDEYYYKAELLDASMVTVQTFSLGSETSPEMTTSIWQEVNNVFSGYGTGVRFVRITHGSKDTEFWAGHYGAVIDDSYVGIQKTGVDVQVTCDSLVWTNGITYYADNNTATDTIDVAGCDSIVTLDLTLSPLDNSTTLFGFTISATQTGATYQWIDCDNNNSTIPNATNQSYTATTNGNYAVVITNANCSDTSNCVNVIVTGVADINNQSNITIYPNPNSGQFSVSLKESSTGILSVKNAIGQTIQQKEFNNTNKLDINFEGTPGIYFLQLEMDGQLIVKKMVKQ